MKYKKDTNGHEPHGNVKRKDNVQGQEVEGRENTIQRDNRKSPGIAKPKRLAHLRQRISAMEKSTCDES